MVRHSARRALLALWRFRAAVRRRRGRRSAHEGVAIRGDSPMWLLALARPSFRLLSADGAEPDGVDVIDVSELDLDRPFVQARLANPARRVRPIDGLPGPFAVAARAAALSASRRDDDRLTATAEAHAAYRQAHLFTIEHAVDALVSARGQRRPPLAVTRQRVAVVCVSNRPEHLDAVLANFGRQVHDAVELVVVTNSDRFDRADADVRVGRVGGRVLHHPASRSLGSCLNAGIAATDCRFVAKFDDDDWYGPNYLRDALIAHAYAEAAVVGKHTYYAHLAASDERVLRFPGHEFRYTSFVAGGTLVIDRARTGDLEFPDLSLGEDRGFLASCLRRGHSIFAADRFNFVQHRGADNTWRVDQAAFLEASMVVAADAPEHRVDR